MGNKITKQEISLNTQHFPSVTCTETLIDASKVVGLEVNAEKTKYMLLSRHQNAGQNQNIKIGDIIIIIIIIQWRFSSCRALVSSYEVP
jgi:hypothetical protein